MNNVMVKDPRKKKGTEKEEWKNGYKEAILKGVGKKQEFSKLQVNYRLQNLWEKDEEFVGCIKMNK